MPGYAERYGAVLNATMTELNPKRWSNGGAISFADLTRALNHSTLSERSEILRFIRANVLRIHPKVSDEWLYDVMADYFISCILLVSSSENAPDSIHTPFEAAHELVSWFNWYVDRCTTKSEVQIRVERLAKLMKQNADSVRNCIETGFLEHVLEKTRNREYFEHWRHDRELSESYIAALEWGESHES